MTFDITSASQALQLVSDDNYSNLPGLATVNDIREAVQFLTRHAEGVTIIQTLDSLQKRIFDPRKVEAYDSWGIIVRSRDRIRLSDLGWELARSRAEETQFFRKLLTQNRTYLATLEWIHQQGLRVISYVELGSFWKASGLASVQFSDDKQIESSAGSFLQLCHAADLGIVLVGRKGQPTRLHIHSEQLSAVVNTDVLGEVHSFPLQPSPRSESNCVSGKFKSTCKQRVFISSSSETDSVKRLLKVLTLAGVDYEFANMAIEERTTTLQDLEQMQQCDSAIAIMTKKDCDQRGEFSATTLIGLGAAIMHFKTRLVLLVENGLSLPAGISISPLTFNHDVSWELAIELLSFVKQTDESGVEDLLLV
jgi:hypothetical protein